MQLENPETERKGRHIGGWVTAFIGASLIVFGIFFLIAEIITALSSWYEGFLGCTVPSLVIGIPLLIYGVRRIKNPATQDMVYSEEITRKNNQFKRRGWLALIFGVLITGFGYLILMIEISAIEDANWYWLVLILTVPSWIFGIPLIIFGIRRINNVQIPGADGAEQAVRKNRFAKIWGWVAVLVGGLITLLVIDTLFISIFSESSEGESTILSCGAPGLFFGVFFLVIGIRRLFTIEESERLLQPENLGTERKRRIGGWIIAIFGVLIILSSIGLFIFFFYALFILSPLKGITEPYPGSYLLSIISSVLWFVLPLFLLGLTLLILGLLKLNENKLSRRSRGIVINITGIVCIVTALFGILIAEIINSNDSGGGVSIVFWSPILLIGALFIIFGIQDVSQARKIASASLGFLNESPHEVL